MGVDAVTKSLETNGFRLDAARKTGRLTPSLC